MEMRRLGKKNFNQSNSFSTHSKIDFHSYRSESQVKYKTELCRNLENGFCEYGDKCYFAHSIEELREKSQGSTIKLMKCKNFFESGYCLQGVKCQYSHKEIFPETAESSPSVSSKNSRKASRDQLKAANFIDLEARSYY